MLIVWIHKSWVRRLDWFLWQEGIKKVRTYAAIVETSQEEASIVPTFRSTQYSTTILILPACCSPSDFSVVLEKGRHRECRSTWYGRPHVWNHIYCFSVTNFPHKWRHSRRRHICGGSKKERFTEFLIHDPQSRTGVQHWFWEIFQDVPYYNCSYWNQTKFFKYLLGT